MEKYNKPIMTLEEMEDEVYTDVAANNNVTTTAIVSGDVITVTPEQPTPAEPNNPPTVVVGPGQLR